MARDGLYPLLGLLVLATSAGGLGLFAWKYQRHRRAIFDDFRYAAYLGALAEVAGRGGYPLQMLRRWTRDPVFFRSLVEYLKFVEGPERDRLVDVARRFGLIDRQVAQLATAHRRLDRVRAAEILTELADPSAAASLVEALDDSCVEVRLQAAVALAEIRDEANVPALLAALEREEGWSASRIADALVELGEVAVPHVARLVLTAHLPGGIDDHTVALAVRVLGQVGDVRAEPALLAVIDGGELEVRIRAAAALGTAATPHAVPALLRALGDDDWRVRAQAATALGAHLDPSTLGSLTEALGDRSWWVRQNAAASLGNIPGGVSALVAALGHPDAFARDAAVERLLVLGVVQDALDAANGGAAEEEQIAILRHFLDTGREAYVAALRDDVALDLMRRAG